MKTSTAALAAVFARLFVSTANASKTGWVKTKSPKEQFSGHVVGLNKDLFVVGGPEQSKEGDGDLFEGLVRIYSKSDDNNKLDLFHEIYGHPNDSLGYAIDVAADSKTVIMGAPWSDAGGKARGYALVLHFNEWKNKWEELGQMITGGIDNGSFGQSVAISDDGLVIAAGSRGDGLGLGLVKVFMYEEISNEWMQVGDLLNGHTPRMEFGMFIDIIGNIHNYYLAVSAPSYEQGIGLTEMFKYDDEMGWMDYGGEIKGYHMQDRSGSGISLGMDEEYVYLAIGTPTTEYYAEDEIGDTGTEGHVQVYRFDISDEDNVWEEFGDEIEQVMEDDKTGSAVTLSRDGRRLVIGSPRYGHVFGKTEYDNFGGLVRVFDYDNSRREYRMVGEYIVGEGTDHLGSSVAIFEDEVAIGAQYGNYAHIYTFRGDDSGSGYGSDGGFVGGVTGSPLNMSRILTFGFLVLIVVFLVICMKKARRAGFRCSSLFKALPLVGTRSRQRNQSTPISTQEKRDEWPFPFFSEGERARIAQIQKQEELEGGNVDRVVLHGMIRKTPGNKSEDSSDGLEDGLSRGSSSKDGDEDDSDEEYDGLRKIT